MVLERVAVPRAADLGSLLDDVLTDRARDGDPRAFEVLVRRYQHPMYALAMRITGSPTDAEDAVQMAFTTAWRKLPGFRGDARFSTWLYRIVTNQSLSLLRRQKPVQPLPDRDNLHPAVANHRGPEACAEHAALAAALSVALAALPSDLRVAWLLREAEHCSYEEVASIVEVKLSTARGRIARARAALARTMQEWR